jgi:hypothetical protein
MRQHEIRFPFFEVDLAMPRQPFKPYADRNRGGQIDIGTQAIEQRPELFSMVGRCLIAWPHVEAEMALVLGQLLGANNAGALAVFQTLRRSIAQRDAISEAAKASLNETDCELVFAALNVHKSVEAERNALAHGHLGIYTVLPDMLLWMTTADYITFKSILVLKGDRIYDEEKREKLNSRLWFYRANDFQQIADDINMLGWIWSDLISYLQTPPIELRAALYRQLCDKPHIARELEKLRRDKNPPTLSGSPPPE